MNPTAKTQLVFQTTAKKQNVNSTTKTVANKSPVTLLNITQSSHSLVPQPSSTAPLKDDARTQKATEPATSLLNRVQSKESLHVHLALPDETAPLKKNTINIQKKATNAKSRAIPYFTLWNHTAHSIHIPNKPPGAPLTSLEILERVLVDNDVGNITEALPSCLVPNSQSTQALVDSGETLQLPILNLGMPKCGSTTLHRFFSCSGMKATHRNDGFCIRKAVLNGKPPISGCRSSESADALCQLDFIFGNCIFPQISLLDEIHQEHPHATFVMNFRPVDDWIHSAENWRPNMVARWSKCIVPGLIKEGEKLTKQEIRNWLCGHVKHVREFVKQYPTHRLIELDLYDTEVSSKAMSSLFNTNATCWGISNVNENVPEKKATNARLPNDTEPKNATYVL
jgi:hypothetical protein